MYERVSGTGRWFRCSVVLMVLCLLCTLFTPRAQALSDVTRLPRMLVPVGHTIGVKMFSKGILVVKLADGGTPAKECGLQTGDVILACNGVTVTSTEQFQMLLQTGGEGAADLQVSRNGQQLMLEVSPQENEQGTYSIGAWVRDSMAGIGTMTYYDPQTGAFGALGHGITDADTAKLMPFSSGSILPSTVKAVKKGVAGDAGELRGNFDLTRDLGTLYANTTSGVFGIMADGETPAGNDSAVPVATADQVHPGPAQILSNVRGDERCAYDIEILKIAEQAPGQRNLVLSVTDPDLLAQTGGIVQGMSGSPVIQNGRIVGAVTHVLVNDPTKGYGILIENMLKAAE